MKRITLSALLMTLFLLLSCGSGQQPQAGKDGSEKGTGSLSAVLMEVGRSAESAFYSFMELVSGTLGLRVTKDTTKQQVGEHFSGLGKKLGEAAAELEEVAKNSEIDVDKGGLLNKVIKEAVDAAKTTLSTLKGHLESLKNIGDGDKLVDVKSDQQGVEADMDALKRALKALQGIVETSEGVGIDKLKESSVKLDQASIGIANAKNGAKVLAAGHKAGEAVGDKAATIVSAVSGREMLESIVKSSEDKVAKITANATASTTPLEFAVGGTAEHVSNSEQSKAAAVAGGIALRSLVKGGKLASHSTNNDEKAVQSAGITAVNKLLVAVEDIIKKTVKNVLDKVKGEVDKARAPKAVVSESGQQ
ncbi:variable large family protein [Borrelia turicatae]|uniref:Variable large protein n=1 Tax=Borrelia turicatae (strain 91E135) TaxID=314724 RepID=A0ABF7R0A8_BORT9|nr:variable large family protein [Borrelia turicatae]ASJ27793.1 VlpA2 [Borrelia turicatae 91E135]UPA14261.1 variable large family protein [Borrelia turicatae 91E135]